MKWTTSTWLTIVMGAVLAELVVLPVQASRKVMAIVPVVEEDASNQVVQPLYEGLKTELMRNHKVKFVDEQKLMDYFAEEAQGATAVSAGDQLYQEAKQSYLQFDSKKAEKQLLKASEIFAQNPGTQSGLFQTHLLMALLEDEQGQNSKAKKSIEAAIALDPSATELSDSFFSPGFRQRYRTVANAFLKAHPPVAVNIQVISQTEKAMVYVNGIPKGSGPIIVTQAMPDHILFLQAGDVGKIYRAKPKPEGENKMKIRGKLSKNKLAAGSTFGFPANLPNIVQESQWLGQKVGAGKIVLLGLQKESGKYLLDLTVVDAANGKTIPAKNFEIDDLQRDGASVSQIMAQYLMSLNKNDFTDASVTDMPILVGKKKSRAALWGLLAGTVLLGGGALLLIATDTGDSASASTEAEIKVDFPQTVEE